MAITILKKGKLPRTNEIQVLKHKMGGFIPDDFLKFIKKNNGATPETNQFEIPILKSGSGVTEFLSIQEIMEQKEKLMGRLPSIAWPIAYAEGGNFVCLVCNKKPGVYFWDHELEQEEGKEPQWNNMFRLSSSFGEFWQTIRKFNPSDIQLKPGQVKSTWVDPNFKPEF